MMGNLTRDPELKFTQGGVAVCDMGIAVSDKYKDKSGETKEDVCFINIVAFGKTGESCGKHLKKGSAIMVEGKIKFEQWEKDGERRSAHKIKAESVQFLSFNKKEEE